VKRAMLMSGGTVKKSRRAVKIGDEDTSDGFTERMLMSMVVDISQLHESVERVRVQVFTLAKEHGISTEI
jgi:hypothetical protein